jgi:hypothetical protein
MNKFKLLIVNGLYAIVTTSVYLLIVKNNTNNDLAPIIVALSSLALLSLLIRFGGNEYLTSEIISNNILKKTFAK